MPDSRLEMPGMLDCCPIGDHVPLIGYWCAEPRDNVQDVFPHNRNKTFMTLRPQKKLKVHTQDTCGSRPPTDTLGGMLLRADTPRIFGSCLKGWRKGLPWIQPGCPIWGDLNGLLLPFSDIVSLLVCQSFNYLFQQHSMVTRQQNSGSIFHWHVKITSDNPGN